MGVKENSITRIAAPNNQSNLYTLSKSITFPEVNVDQYCFKQPPLNSTLMPELYHLKLTNFLPFILASSILFVN